MENAPVYHLAQSTYARVWRTIVAYSQMPSSSSFITPVQETPLEGVPTFAWCGDIVIVKVVNGMKGRVVDMSACCTGLFNGMNNRVRASFVFSFEFVCWRGVDDVCSKLMTTSGTSEKWAVDSVLKFYMVMVINRK